MTKRQMTAIMAGPACALAWSPSDASLLSRAQLNITLKARLCRVLRRWECLSRNPFRPLNSNRASVRGPTCELK